MNTTPHSDDGDPTVSMPARAGAAPPAPARPRRTRLPSLSVLAAIGLFAVAAVGAFIVVERMKPFRTPATPVPTAAAPQMTPRASVPAPPPSPRAPDKPSTPRQMLNEIFEGRDRGHTVTAGVEGGAVRIRSSSPGYVYVLAASAGQSEGAPLFVGVLFPRAADTNNRIRAAQTMTLPDLQWPANAEFLAIVSDERREIDVLGSLVGQPVCSSSTSRCSEAYGAVVFSTEGLRTTAGSPTTPSSVVPPKGSSVPKAPAARPASSVSRRCSDILERASLGETLTDEEQTYLTKDCR